MPSFLISDQTIEIDIVLPEGVVLEEKNGHFSPYLGVDRIYKDGKEGTTYTDLGKGVWLAHRFNTSDVEDSYLNEEGFYVRWTRSKNEHSHWLLVTRPFEKGIDGVKYNFFTPRQHNEFALAEYVRDELARNMTTDWKVHLVDDLNGICLPTFPKGIRCVSWRGNSYEYAALQDLTLIHADGEFNETHLYACKSRFPSLR